jgi:hypothetical protein
MCAVVMIMLICATVQVVSLHGPPVGSIVNGTCGHTDWDSNCDTDPKGAFHIEKEGIKDLAGCVARVKQCSQGLFASFSADHLDCSWYSACEGWPHLEDASIYQTEALPPPPPPPPTKITVNIDWSKETRRTSTAATVEVDVMPFLARQPATDPFVTSHYGGPFEKYYEALSNLNASFVRFAPWCPNPRLVVPELIPPNCTASEPATNWNSTFFDQLMKDFMTAVCGEGAASGQCARLSVIMQLSTMPSWMYVGGMDVADIPANPFIPTPQGHKQYEQGGALVDKTCETMARHIGRVVGWYTKGGFDDECGHWHASGLHYNWHGLSILNEDEHQIRPERGVAYTTCFDAVRAQLRQINSTIIPIGPEISGQCQYPSSEFQYLKYFMDPAHHTDKFTPPVGSYHIGISAGNSTLEQFYTQWDSALNGFVPAVDKLLRGGQQLILNEFVNYVSDWCDCDGVRDLCPGWSKPGDKCPSWEEAASAGGDPDLTHGKGVKINRHSWSWNAAAGVFAYAFGSLAEYGYLLVGQDQLVAGTWPDNEPGVAMLDWVTGEPNAKYYVTQLLASTIGAAVEKALFSHTATAGDAGADDAGDAAFTGIDASATLYALPFRFTAAGGSKGVLVVNKKAAVLDVTLTGLSAAASATVVEVAPSFAGGPGFQPPQKRQLSSTGVLSLGPFAVAVVLE